MRERLIFPRLVSGVKLLAGTRFEIPSTVGLLKIVRRNLPSVNQGDNNRVGDDRAKFLHQIQGKARLSVFHLMEEPDVRVHPDYLDCGHHIRC